MKRKRDEKRKKVTAFVSCDICNGFEPIYVLQKYTENWNGNIRPRMRKPKINLFDTLFNVTAHKLRKSKWISSDHSHYQFNFCVRSVTIRKQINKQNAYTHTNTNTCDELLCTHFSAWRNFWTMMIFVTLEKFIFNIRTGFLLQSMPNQHTRLNTHMLCVCLGININFAVQVWLRIVLQWMYACMCAWINNTSFNT